MKPVFKTVIAFVLLLHGYNAFAQTLAFPEALGFGRYATGGRTGTVYHVTNLDDSGTGSFRDAVSASNRIVVFDVGGYITLKTAVSCKSNITIAGQTAPGGGIGFRGGEISFAKQSNVICRGIRIRPGSETESTTDDALSIYLAKNAIFDHCSFEFAPWNNIDGVGNNSTGYLVTNITFQNCLIANPTGQQFGAHCESVGSDWSWFYNVFANSHNRNPLAKTNTVFVNNVNYNYSAAYTTHTSTSFKHDIVNNYFIFGPASTGTDNTWFQVDKNQSIYYSGNMKDKTLDGTLNGSETTPYWYQGAGTILTAPWSDVTKNLAIYSAATAYRFVSSMAGTFPYDEMDQLIMSQVYTLGSGTTGYVAGTRGPASGLYTTQAQTGLGNSGYGTIASGTKPTDTDNDGMPDFWEKTNSLNASSNEAMTVGSDGYTNIERYINWMGELHAQVNENSYVDIDLATYTAGFAKVSPTFVTKNAKNGTAIVQSNGHSVRFTPTANYYGMASFSFTVTGNDNTAYTTTVYLAVVPSNIVMVARKYVYVYDNSGNLSWSNSNSWTPVAVPSSIDTAVIRTGEVQIANLGLTAPVYVESNGILRLTDTSSVSKLTMQGGTLKVYTSSAGFQLASDITMQTASTFMAGSVAASVFELQGTITGSGTITKTSVGILRVAASASAYTGTWKVTAGKLQIRNANGLGQCGVEVDSAANLDVETACTTNALVVENGGTVNLDASLTVQMAVLGDINLPAGTYTAASYPTIITGTGTLTVQKSIIVAGAPAAGSVTLTAGSGSSYLWSNGTSTVATTSTYTTTVTGTYSVKVTSSVGCAVTSAPVSVTPGDPNIAPTVSLTAPVANQSYYAPASVTLTATAADADGTIAKVEFYNGTTLLGTVILFPYTFTWASVAVGTYTLTAKATDNSGGTTTSTAVKITVVQKPLKYIYVYDNSGNYLWSNTGSWTPAAVPSGIDTSVIRTGEVRIAKLTIPAPVFVETNGILRLTDTCTVSKLTLQGGTLKSYTSNPCFQLTSDITVQTASTVMAGSLAASVFELQGTISGSADVTKTSVGVLRINSSATTFTGKWLLATGTLQVKNATALGVCGAIADAASTLDIQTDASTYSVVMKTGSTINLASNLTVNAAVIGSQNLVSGTYTSTDFPGVITGTGTLIVKNSLVQVDTLFNGSILLSSDAGKQYNWLMGTTSVSTTNSYNTTAPGAFTLETVSAEGCALTSAPLGVTVDLNKTLTISLSAGWNIISINVIPADSTIETLFSDLDPIEIKTMDAFWGKGQLPVFNSLTTISPGNGYIVNMNSAGELMVAGTPNLEGFQNLQGLQAGWQLIGCPYQESTPFSNDFSDANCIEIKDFDGFWMPNGTLNSIQDLEPGKGYFMK